MIVKLHSCLCEFLTSSMKIKLLMTHFLHLTVHMLKVQYGQNEKIHGS